MAGISWSAAARADLQRIVTRIAREASPRTAREWGDRLRAAVDLLETLPEIGSPVEDVPIAGLRERIVGPYRIIYQFDGTDCRVLAIPRAEQDLSRVLSPDDFG